MLLIPLVLLSAPASRGEYVVLLSGQRLIITGYQLLGDKYRLQMAGGLVEIPAEQVMAIEPEEVFTPVPAKPVAQARYRDLVEAAARRYHVDADLIASVIAAESNFDPKAKSRRDARGLMQLLPQTAARLGVQNIYDPRENIDGGTRYLGELLRKYNNDVVLALAAYNAGPQRVEQYGRVPPFAETISYVRRVKHGYEKSKSGMAIKRATPSAAMAVSSLPPRNQVQ